MNEREDLIARLRALGSQPVRPEVAEQHLAALDLPESAGRGFWGHRLRVVAAFAVGLLAGTTGLATAGALPHGAQEVAHRTLGAVGVKVPHGDRYQGPECSGTFKNHGQYVRSQPKDKRAEAAASRCGKPVHAGGDADPGDGDAGPGAKCQGPPPWAGQGKPDAAAKAGWKQNCQKADGGSDTEKDGPAPAAGGQPAAPAAPETPADPAPGNETSGTDGETGTGTTGATGTGGGTGTSGGTGTTGATGTGGGTGTSGGTGTGGGSGTTGATGAGGATATTDPAGGSETTDTTGTTGTTGAPGGSDGDGGGTNPSLPVEPPAAGQAA